jgi:hypothetical protein
VGVLIDSLGKDRMMTNSEYKKRLIVKTRNDITASFPPEIVGLILNRAE